MRRTLLTAITLTTVLAFSGISLAEETAQQAPAAAQPAAPAETGDKAVEPAQGCMPDGSCCGKGACAHAGTSEDKPATADDATGGCPCMRMQKKKM